MGNAKGAELYMSMVNIVDYLALNNLSLEEKADLYEALDALLRVEAKQHETSTEDAFDAIADANDAGGVKSWMEMVEVFKELWEKGERVNV